MSAVAEVLTALADPTRRDLLELLSTRSGASATMLAGELPISRQAVAQHLAVLSDVGLVRGTRDGRERRFEVRTDRLTETAKWFEDLAAQWDRRLRDIKRLAEQVSDEPHKIP